MKIIYNVTVKPDKSIQEEFVQWIIEEHAQEVIDTGCFDSYEFYKVLEEDETQGATFAIQYATTSMSRYFDYISKYADGLRQKGEARFPNKIHAFRTILKQLK
ncbi:MAG: DUF4286 family protein [Chitinophagales bacterium]|jgi:hypothetical protein|nr:DUF4286 family protein [Chitinophagales bacterium]